MTDMMGHALTATWGNVIHMADSGFVTHMYSSMSDLIQAIKARQEAFMKAYNSGDAKGAAALFENDCYFMYSGQPRKGRAAIEEYFKKCMSGGIQQMQIVTEEVNGGGEWAFGRGTYHLVKSQGKESGAQLQVYRKIGGEWFIHIDYSVDFTK